MRRSIVMLAGAVAVVCAIGVATSGCSDGEESEGSNGGSGIGGTSTGASGGTNASGGTGAGGSGGTGGCVDETGGTAATAGSTPAPGECSYGNSKPASEWCSYGSWCAAETSLCVPQAWSCSLWEYADEVCSCGCGAPDPACSDPKAALAGCAPGRTCSPAGECQGVPAAWTCDSSDYAAGDGCDCKCGVVDADCTPGGAAAACAAGESCNAAGLCVKPGAPAPQVTIDSYPKVDGATATHPLAMVIASELLGIPWRWYCCANEGKDVEPAPVTPAQTAIATQLSQKIVHTKTHQSYVNLIDGVADLILVASKPSAEEQSYASSKGVSLDVELVARDALVFLVNAKNPVTSLSVDQIQGVFSQKIDNWHDLGGPCKAIQPYVRQSESGSQQLMQELVMKEQPMGVFPDQFEIVSMGGLVDKLREDPLGIGYSVYYFVTYQYVGSGTRLLQVEGVWPTFDTIQKQTYPLTSETLLVTRTNLAPSSTAAQLRSWLLAPEGQAIVKKSGYVPVVQ